MKKIIAVGLLTCIFTTAIFAQTSTQKVLRHVVLFKFKETATEANIKTVVDAFLVLPSKIKSIKKFEYGVNNSPEKLNDGLTHCFLVTFSSEKDRDNYLVDPAHLAFVEVLKPFLDKPVVIDYWAIK